MKNILQPGESTHLAIITDNNMWEWCLLILEPNSSNIEKLININWSYESCTIMNGKFKPTAPSSGETEEVHM